MELMELIFIILNTILININIKKFKKLILIILIIYLLNLIFKYLINNFLMFKI